jgi:hypothetical protein
MYVLYKESSTLNIKLINYRLMAQKVVENIFGIHIF